MKRHHLIFPLLGTLTLSACTAGVKPEGRLPNPQAVKGILLRLPSPDGENQKPDELTRAVSQNLSAWGYAIAGRAGDLAMTPTHIMTVSVGRMEQHSTPMGFSFAIGNSDPRARNFQQADTVPVTCTLTSVESAKESASLTLRFGSEAASSDLRNSKIWIDHIGTACYNLLTDLKIPRQTKAGTSETRSPAWMPEVRIEVKPKPNPSAVPAQTAQPSVPLGSDSAPTSETSGIQTETQGNEGRRQVIIHNQGSPVILEFGYDRR